MPKMVATHTVNDVKNWASKDSFGIRIVYTPVAPQPNTLPNSTPQLLKGGDIKVQ